MSSISDLRTRLQSKIQSDQAEAEKSTQAALQQHASNLSELLNDELTLMQNAIQSYQKTLNDSMNSMNKRMLIVSAVPLVVSLILVILALTPLFKKPAIYYQPMILAEEQKDEVIQKMSDGKTYKLLIDRPALTCDYNRKKVMCYEVKVKEKK